MTTIRRDVSAKSMQADATDVNDVSTPEPNQRTAALTLVLLSAAVFLTALDQTVVATALLPIANSFDLPFQNYLPQLSWIVSGYLLGYVIVMPLMGRVSDIYGRRRLLIGCLTLFGVASLLCSLATTLGNAFPLTFLERLGINSPAPALTWMVIARFIQAIGGGAVVPIAIAAIGDLYGSKRRILALGIIGGVTEAGGALGPLYGAIIVQKWPLLPHMFDQTWQWIFLLNIPLVILIIGALLLLWPRHAIATTTQSPSQRRIDWWGAAILGGSLLCLSVGLGQEASVISTVNNNNVTASQNNPILIGAAIILLGVFILAEARQKEPVVDLSLFRSRAFSAGAIYSLFLGISLIVALIDIPAFVFAVFNTTAYLDAGLALLRMTIMIPIGAFAGGWLVTRYGCRPVGIAGAFITATGFFLMHHWGANVSWTEITIGTMITGLGFGLIVAPISTTALNTASPQRFGMAASISTALRIIGMILGLAGLSSWGLSRVQDLTIQARQGIDLSNPDQLNILSQRLVDVAIHVITDFYLVGGIVALLAVIPAFFLWKPAAGTKTDVATFSMDL